MLNSRLKYISVLLCICVLLMSACKSHKLLDKTVDSSIFSSSIQNLNTKTVLAISQGERSFLSVNTQIKIRKDSLILISVQPLPGMEVVRVLFSEDEVLLVDRANKRYFKTSYKEIGNRLHTEFNYHSLQSVLLGELFAIEKPVTIDESEFLQTKVVGDSQKILYQRSYQNYLQEFYVTGQTVESGSVMNENGSVKWNYYIGTGNFVYNSRVYPEKTEIGLGANGQSPFLFSLSHKKVTFDLPTNLNYQVPESYTQLTFDELIQLFKN